MITITIMRPNHGIQLLTVDPMHLVGYSIFPDNKPRDGSDFPHEGITITRKHQGHLVIAHRHMEKWVLSGFSSAAVDLSSFSDNWKGCCVMFLSEDFIKNTCDQTIFSRCNNTAAGSEYLDKKGILLVTNGLGGAEGSVFSNSTTKCLGGADGSNSVFVSSRKNPSTSSTNGK